MGLTFEELGYVTNLIPFPSLDSLFYSCLQQGSTISSCLSLLTWFPSFSLHLLNLPFYLDLLVVSGRLVTVVLSLCSMPCLHIGVSPSLLLHGLALSLPHLRPPRPCADLVARHVRVSVAVIFVRSMMLMLYLVALGQNH